MATHSRKTPPRVFSCLPAGAKMSIKSSVIHAAVSSSAGSIHGFVGGTAIITILTFRRRKKDMPLPQRRWRVALSRCQVPVDRARVGGPEGPRDGCGGPSQKRQAEDPYKHTCFTFLTKSVFGLVCTSYVPQTHRQTYCLGLINSF